ncbi:MAG TPA: BamA/TamA family outer membrane protein [Polyangiales bacterium]|nr:BamA/TamA family outer membrane protein [Polyangiales bacterium]
MWKAPKLALFAIISWHAAGCATIPPDRYGINDVEISGAEQISEEELKICLSTREREHVDIVFGFNEAGKCGEPPFAEKSRRVELWPWPWADWPLLDLVALERDRERIERWYEARGFHAAEVVKIEVEPAQAAQDETIPPDEDPDCERRRRGQGCVAKVWFTVEEGPPTSIAEVDIEGTASISRETVERLHEANQLQPGDRFDEALFDESRARMREVFGTEGFALAEVRGVARVDASERKAWVSYSLEPGPKCVFGKVLVEGADYLPVEPITAATLIDPGDPYDLDDLRDAQRAVVGLGGIAAASVEPVLPREGNVIDVRVRVTPVRKQGFALGAGIQAGELETLTENISIPQWDVHLLGRYRHSNLFGGMRQLLIEERPRVIVQREFPRVTVPRFGNDLRIGLRQPGFVEPRTALIVNAAHHYGPDPFDVFFRHRIDTELAVERDFWEGKLFARLGMGNSVFRVPPGELTFNGSAPPSNSVVTYFEQIVRLDFRDDIPRPHKGAMVSLAAQEAGYGLPSSWSYVRLVPEARFYVPLPARITIAARFALGMYFITSAYPNLDALQQELGPRDFRLRGGGASSNRGFPPGRLGDGLEGGTRRWLASIELRVPITKILSIAGFMDMGDVSREERFRFDYPQAASGFGLRFFTLVGVIRFDFAWKIPGLQVLAATDERVVDVDSEGDPIGRGGKFVFHLTIGQPF